MSPRREADARWVVMYIGHHRGVYNSAYTGTLIALAGALWLTLGGFYVVRNAIGRDQSSGVGRLLAATPMRTAGYLFGKFLSNLPDPRLDGRGAGGHRAGGAGGAR